MLKEKKAIVFAGFTAIILTISKLFVGIMTNSMAIISSAVDSILDFSVSLVNLFAVRKSFQPSDEDHNYGHGKIEGLGAIFEGSIITISGILIIFYSIKKIINKDVITGIDTSVYMMIFAIIITTILVSYLSKVAKETNSLIVKSDLLHYKTDLYTNFGIIISLIILKITGFVLIDSIVSICIAFYIIYSSIGIIKEGYDMIMDKCLEEEILESIKKIIFNTDNRVRSYHFMKTRQSGKNKFIEFHLVFDEKISLWDAHNIADNIENQILSLIENSAVMIHLDPYDDSIEKIV